MESHEDQQSQGQRAESSGGCIPGADPESSAEQGPFKGLETEGGQFFLIEKRFILLCLFCSIFSIAWVACDYKKDHLEYLHITLCRRP